MGYSATSVESSRNWAQLMVAGVVCSFIAHTLGVSDIIFYIDKVSHVADENGHFWRIALIGPGLATISMCLMLYYILEWLRMYAYSLITGGAGADFAVPGAKDAIYRLAKGGKGTDSSIPSKPDVPRNIMETYHGIYLDADRYKARQDWIAGYSVFHAIVTVIGGLGGSGSLFVWSIVRRIDCNGDVLCDGDLISNHVHDFWISIFTILFFIMIVFTGYSLFWAWRLWRHDGMNTDDSTGFAGTKNTNRGLKSGEKDSLLKDNDPNFVSIDMTQSFAASPYSEYSETQVHMNPEDSVSLHNRKTGFDGLTVDSSSFSGQQFVEPIDEPIWGTANSDE